MNVMAALDARPTQASPKKSGKVAPKTLKSGIGPRPSVSADEIRAKIAKQNEGPVKTVIAKTENRVTSSFNDNPEEVQRRSEEAKRALSLKKQATVESAQNVSEGEEPLAPRRSDVGNNDPKDPATVGKLKDMLAKGAFKFSDKEREALSKILT